jgi:hypothetical protein
MEGLNSKVRLLTQRLWALTAAVRAGRTIGGLS